VEAISVPIARSTAGVEPFYLYQTFLSLFSPFSSNIRHKLFFWNSPFSPNIEDLG